MGPLAPFTLVGTWALPGVVTWFETVETYVINLESGDHDLVSWHGFENRTQVQWMLFGPANHAVAVGACCE